MSVFKIVVAVALFMTSVTFEEHILISKNGIDSTWNVSFSVPVSHAAMEAEMAF